jgi:hypothetical protein
MKTLALIAFFVSATAFAGAAVAPVPHPAPPGWHINGMAFILHA